MDRSANYEDVAKVINFLTSKQAYYINGANIEVAGGLVLNLHAGRQNVKNNSAFSYSDWKIGVTKDFGFASGSVAVIGTNADDIAYASPANGKFLGKTALVVSVSKTF